MKSPILGVQRVFGNGSVQPESSNARQPRARATRSPKLSRPEITRSGLRCYNQSDDDKDHNRRYDDTRESRDDEFVAAGDNAHGDLKSTDAGDGDGQYSKVKVIDHKPEGVSRSKTKGFLLDWGKRYVKDKERYQWQVSKNVGVGLRNDY